MLRHKTEQNLPTRVWHSQQEVLLKQWAEIASGYRWLYDKSYRAYKRQSLNFTIPVIIMSTLTGTANFAQESFPESWKTTVPMVIGGVNLIAAIITTVSQFLKVNEMMEGSRVSSMDFGKLKRKITVELNLPHNERSSEGSDFLRDCQSRFDQLIEQSPPIPKEILSAYRKQFSDSDFAKPEILTIESVDIFEDIAAHQSNMLVKAARKFSILKRDDDLKQKQDQINKEMVGIFEGHVKEKAAKIKLASESSDSFHVKEKAIEIKLTTPESSQVEEEVVNSDNVV